MRKKYLAAIIIVFQLSFLGSMIIFHNAQLKDATLILLKTVPYDPVSVFRGHYATLRYEISSLPVTLLKDIHPKDLREGDELFVLLKKGGEDCWEAQAIYKNKKLAPKGDEVYLSGRLKYYYYIGRSRQPENLQLEYGIESFFLEETSAKEVERQNFGGGGWQERQQRRKELLAQLDDETRRISEAKITKWWVDMLENELKAWVKEGLVTKERGDKIQGKYRTALEKIASVEKELNLRSTPSRKPIIAQIAVDRDGKGHTLRLFAGDKVY